MTMKNPNHSLIDVHVPSQIHRNIKGGDPQRSLAQLPTQSSITNSRSGQPCFCLANTWKPSMSSLGIIPALNYPPSRYFSPNVWFEFPKPQLITIAPALIYNSSFTTSKECDHVLGFKGNEIFTAGKNRVWEETTQRFICQTETLKQLLVCT